MTTKNAAGVTLIDANDINPHSSLNAALNQVAGLLRDYRDVSLVGVGASYTLLITDATPEGRTPVLRLTGSQTASKDVLINPSEGLRRFVFWNNTTEGGSDTTATIKTTAVGSAGVLVPRGFWMEVWHDGTNVYPLGLPFDSSGRVPQARVYNSADISISNAAFAAVTFNSERYDVGGVHSTSSNTDRLTVPCAGLYLVTFHGVFAANATGARFAQLELNGATVIAEDNKMNTGASHSARVNITTQYRLARNDYVRARVYQDSGGALNLLALGNYSPEFSIVMVGH